MAHAQILLICSTLREEPNNNNKGKSTLRVPRDEEGSVCMCRNHVEQEVMPKKPCVQSEMEKCFFRSTPLGRDRKHNRYWFFKQDGRIFVENYESTEWGYYQSKNEVDALIGSLNTKGVRERALKQQLQQSYDKI